MTRNCVINRLIRIKEIHMRILLALLIGAVFSGCAVSIDGEDYLQQSPDMDLMTFFEGEVKAWGIVQNRSGNVVQRFEVDIIGTINGKTITLDETFRYGLGEGPEKRIWTITELSPGVYEGSATDIPGPAAGRDYGNALFWGYEMDLPVGDKVYAVKFEDWMWALDEDKLVNRSYIKKYGLVVAEVTIFMQRQ